VARSSNPFFVEEGSLGIYLKQISNHETLTAKQEAELAVKIRKGDRRALERLVSANLRFVVSVARNYQNQGLPLADLINEGNVGLIRAAKRFDEKKNFKFISYAVWWIRQSILQGLAEQSRIVKVPLNRVGTIHKIGKTRGMLEQKLHRLPNNEELATELGMSESDVHETTRIGNTHASLDAPVLDDGDSKMIDILTNPDQDQPDTTTQFSSIQAMVNDTLGMLSEREREVIKMYFGIGHETAYTLEEIGAHVNITRERVRQIKERALDKLKKSDIRGQYKTHDVF